MLRRRMHKQLKLVVMVGGCLKALPRVDRQRIDGDDKGANWLQCLPPSDATEYSHVVAASRLGPDRCAVKFRAGHVQHWQRVALSRRAHCRISHSRRLSSWQDVNVPYFGIFATRFDSASHAIFAPFRNGTHSSSESSTAALVQSFSPLMTALQSASASAGCSMKDDLRCHRGSARAGTHHSVQGHHDAHSFSFMHVPVSYVHERPVAVNLDPSCNRPTYPRALTHGAASLRPPAGQLAGRALHTQPVQPFSSRPGTRR